MAYKSHIFTGGDVSSNTANADLLDVDKLGGITLDVSAPVTGKVLKYTGTIIEFAEDSVPDDVIRTTRTAIDDTDSPYTVLSTDRLIGVDTNVATVSMVLPTAVGWTSPIVIKDEGGASFGAKSIVVTPDGIETIDGGATYTIRSGYGSITLYSDGADWFVI